VKTRGEPISKDDARAELARRELARRDLLRFGQYMLPTFKLYAHQKLVADALKGIVEYVESRGEHGTGRLMVLMPPQHGKSLLAAVLFSAWTLGKWPNWRFVMVSYNAKRAERNSKAVRDMVNSQPYRAVFGDLAGREDAVSLSSDSRGISAWSLAQPNSGGMISAGVGGSVTGYDARIIIIDDPFASRDEAESASEREKVMELYESQVYSRQQDGTAIILFHTRWHADDLAGKLIKNMVNNPAADQWNIVCMPALALGPGQYPGSVAEQVEMMRDGVYLPLVDPLGREPDVTLCDEIVKQGLMENIRQNMGAYNWSSLYQQMPYSRLGGMFKREWFVVVDKLPEDVKFLQAVWYWDAAASSGSGDYSAGVLMALDQFGRVWVLQVVRGQYSTFERRKAMKDAYLAGRARFGVRLPSAGLWHPQDPASAGLDSARDTNKALAGLPAHFETVSGSKETRAEPWSSALESDNVRLLKGSWNQGFIDEHLSFPKGRNDDQVDAASSCYSRLALKTSTRSIQVLDY
jgi:predicted phage terminase large subunit-like protein